MIVIFFKGLLGNKRYGGREIHQYVIHVDVDDLFVHSKVFCAKIGLFHKLVMGSVDCKACRRRSVDEWIIFATLLQERLRQPLWT